MLEHTKKLNKPGDLAMNLNLSDLRRDFKLTYKSAPSVATRIKVLIELTRIESEYIGQIKKTGKSVSIYSLIAASKISERTLFRWKSSYLKSGVSGLTKKKITGRKAKAVTGHIAKHIKKMRKLYRWGAEVIQIHLEKDHSIKISKSRIERYLTLSGLRKKYPCTTKKRKMGRKKKHTKIVKVHHPGKHTQIDVKHQPHLLPNKEKCYVYNFIDHGSNWSFKKAYDSYGPMETRDFIKTLLHRCPFIIEKLQSDHKVEFTNRHLTHIANPREHILDKICDANNINHKLIPIGEKELQGLVERSHRQDDQELYIRINPNHLKEFNDQLRFHCRWRNSSRRFKKLGWRTPDEWLENYLVAHMAQINLLKEYQDIDENNYDSMELAA